MLKRSQEKLKLNKKIMTLYNQYTSYYTKNACSIVSLLQVLLYRYGILVKPDYIIKLAIYFDKLGKFSITGGATFKVIDTAFITYLNWKTGLKFKLVNNTILNLKEDDYNTYQIGITNYSTYRWNKAKHGGVITKADIDYLEYLGGVGHALNFDGSAGGYLIDTNMSANTKLSKAVLRYGVEKGVFFKNIRTISPVDEETKKVCHLCIRLFQAEKKGRLEDYLEVNADNKYLAKAQALYNIGK